MRKKLTRIAACSTLLALFVIAAAPCASSQTPSPDRPTPPAATSQTTARPSPTPANAPATPRAADEDEQRTPPDAAPQATAVSPDEADLSITANVTARELRFEVVPNPTVEFTGKPRRETVWDAERQNLPRPVRPGETYRDIGIRLRITSVFADIDRIVAEALGEVPASDEAPGQTERPSQTPPAQTPPQTPSSVNAPAPAGVGNASSPSSAGAEAAPRAGLSRSPKPRSTKSAARLAPPNAIPTSPPTRQQSTGRTPR